MKQTFIALLGDKSSSAEDCKQFLNENVTNGKLTFDEDDLPSTYTDNPYAWNAEYFSTNLNILKLSGRFSKALAYHLVEVKARLQPKVENIVKETEKAVETPISPPQDSNKRENVISQNQKIEKPNLSGFMPNEKLQNLLQDNELSKIRTNLMMLLNSRKVSIEELVKSIYYVFEKNNSVFEKYKETAFVLAIDLDESHWNESYFDLQQVYLNQNFALERVLHLVNVRQQLKGFDYVEQPKVETVSPNNQPTAEMEQKTAQNSPHVESKVEPKLDTSQKSEPRNEQKYEPSSESQPEPDNDFVKTALMVGGAVVALLGALFVIFK